MSPKWWKDEDKLKEITDKDRLSDLEFYCLETTNRAPFLSYHNIVNLFIEKFSRDNVILRYSVDCISFENSFDAIDNKWIEPRWFCELVEQSENSNRVVLVFEIPDNYSDDYAINWLRLIAKDRGDCRLLIPDNVSIIISLPYRDYRIESRNFKELVGLCIGQHMSV